MTITAYPPLPVRADWAPPWGHGDNRDFSFNVADPQGPGGLHSAVDWFAPGGTTVASPATGVVTRSQPSRGETGQVFGGVVGVSDHAGRVWTMRHVNPTVPVGRFVEAGDMVATVTDWRDGGPHLHMEIWRTAEGGYTRANMIDPASVEWMEACDPEPVAAFWMEERPFLDGGMGPVVRGPSEGYANAASAAVAVARLRASGAKVSTVRSGGRVFILQWAPGTYGEPFRWGPWGSESNRNAAATKREQNTGRVMRRFRGRGASLYPWPDNA